MEHLAVAQDEFLTAPLDAIGSEGREPHRKIEQITERDKPEPAAKSSILQTPDARDPCQGQTQNEICGEVRGADPSSGGHGSGEQREREAVREEQSEKR